MDEKRIPIIGFFHENEAYGCFSNWYPAEFDYAGKHFMNSEQFMMYHKVMMFGQHELAGKIMANPDPQTCKNIARTKFPEFDAKLWDKTSRQAVKRGVRAKFRQNQPLLEELLDTGGALLAECSPYDTKWGIGIDIHDLARQDVSAWKGKNLLGRILMEVREELGAELRLSPTGTLDCSPEYYGSDIPEWNMTAGELKRVPQYYDAIHAYADTLGSYHLKQAFYHGHTLAQVEDMMRANMGGGLPAPGFYEMKWDVYDVARRMGCADDADAKRLEWCKRHLPMLQAIDASEELKSWCRAFSVYKPVTTHTWLDRYLYRCFMQEAYESNVVIGDYKSLVEEYGMQESVANPRAELLDTLDREHILACIAWHFRRDHFSEGSLVRDSIGNGHMLRMVEAYLGKCGKENG